MRNLPLRASLSDRFHAKVDKTDGCWLWTGAKKELGYGVIGLGRRADGTAKAHRVAYMLYKGDIAEGMNICHTCDNPSCVNPGHLYAGTLSDNSKDAVKRGRNFIPDNRGEKAKWHKLKEYQAIDIKKREKAAVEYATMYGVSRSSIYQIWNGKNWAHVSIENTIST